MVKTIVLFLVLILTGCGINDPQPEPDYIILLEDDIFPPTPDFDDGLLLNPCDTCKNAN